MKREIKIDSKLACQISTATIIIDKNGMRVENKEPSYKTDNYFIRSFLTRCIDMDGWYHSWYLDVDKAKLKRSEDRKKIRKILNEKIAQRKQEIQLLKDARNVLGRW